MQLVKIYTLIDPRDGCVFYVGATSQDLHSRLLGHSNKPRILEIKEAGMRPVINIIDLVDANEAGEREWEWIERYRSWGYALENGPFKSGYGTTYVMPEPQPNRIIRASDIQIYRAFSPGYFRQLTFTEDLIDSEQWDFFKSFCKQELGKDWEYEPTTYVDDLTSIGHYELRGYQFITLPKKQAA